MKKIKVKKAEPIELEFSDKKKICLVFSMNALLVLGEEINERKIKLNGPEFISAIIYSGAKAYNPDFTREEGDALYITLSESYPDALNAIVDEYCDAAGIDVDSVKKNLILKMM